MGAQPVRRIGWLYQVPPWRAPRLRRHHHHHVEIVEGMFLMMGWFLYVTFFFELWMLEAMLWATVWFYYGAFLVIRWLWQQSRPAEASPTPTNPTPPAPAVVSGRPGSMRRRS